jgi:hypothetical protein
MTRMNIAQLCMVCCLAFLPATSHAQQSTAQVQSGSDGFRWIPWLNAGDQIWRTVLRIEPKLKDVIGDGSTVSVAIVDLDYSGQNEIILYFGNADECSVNGCLYLVLGNNGQYKRAFIARTFKRSGQGINIDGRYYKL